MAFFLDAKPYDPEKLAITEVFWRDHQKWLQDRGYMLRPRYMPDWTPSWTGKNIPDVMDCEDAQPLKRGNTCCDATRISDGAYVLLKIVEPSVHPYEADISTFVTMEPIVSDPRNHCVQLYEILTVPDEDDKILLVLPLLKAWRDPMFQTVGEGVDFFKQIFEGVQFMHENHLAHRDISPLNIMMDGAMYPEPWHPTLDIQKRDNFKESVRPFTRTQRPPKYYFIDFGISRWYDPKSGPHPLEPPIRGGDKSVPEFQNSIEPCDPFATDIYYVGNVIRQSILKEYRGFSFMRRLVSDMVQDDPAKRPTIDEVVTRFEKIRHKLGLAQLAMRAGPREEWFGRVLDLGYRLRLAVQGILSRT